MERAVDWLFSHPEKESSLEQNADQTRERTHKGKFIIKFIIKEINGKYKLQAFISHKGTNTGCGHYVAHVKHNDEWILFNDERVAKVPMDDIQEATSAGYVYYYTRM